MAKSKCTEGVGLILISYDGIKHHKYDQYDEIGFWYSSSVTSSNMIHLMFFSDNMQLPNHVSYGKTLNDIKDNPMINKVKLLKYSNAVAVHQCARDRDRNVLPAGAIAD